MLTEWIATQVAAGGVNENVFANSRYATLSRPAMITYYGVVDTADPGDGQVEITHGNVIIRSLSPVPDVTAPEGPLLDRHMIAMAVADINDRVVIKEVNNDAVNVANFRVLVSINFA